MIILLSPAKTLDFANPAPTEQSTKPQFHTEANRLAAQVGQLSTAELQKLMNISENLGDQVHKFFADWSNQYQVKRAKQAIYAFRGAVYRGFDADTADKQTIDYAQQHLRILSGLYGLLRPFDLMQPYRLEMGTELSGEYGMNLYEHWGDSIARLIDRQLKAHDSPRVVNLASQEYFKAAQINSVDCELVTPIFRELHKGKYKVMSFLAKVSRGVMARWICEKRVDTVAGLRRFREGGYEYNADMSSDTELVFTRDERL